MAASSKMKKQAAAAAKVARKQARRARVDESRRLSLQNASVQNGRPLTQSKGSPYARRVQHVDADAESGLGLVARLRAFLSLRGFKTSGIMTAQALSTPIRTHRDRRVLVSSRAASRPRQPQLPKLSTVPRPGPQPKINALRKQRVKRLRQPPEPPQPLLHRLLRRNRILTPSVTLGLKSIDTLRRDLGLLNKGDSIEDGVYVAIDTEGSRLVREIGITTLDTRDIMGISPDHRAANWISKIKHHHVVLSRGTNVVPDTFRLRTAIFCTSQLATPDNARSLVLALLQHARQPSSLHAPRKVHLVGQSIACDIAVMKDSPGLRLDLSHGLDADFSFDNVFDTHTLSLAAENNGAFFHSMSLGPLARRLEVSPKYWNGATVRGVHNASNDAAYTMMVMLLFAVRWDSLGQELPLPPSPSSPAPQLRANLHLSPEEGIPVASTREKTKRSMREHFNWRIREQRLAREGQSAARRGLLGKLERAFSGLMWGWR